MCQLAPLGAAQEHPGHISLCTPYDRNIGCSQHGSGCRSESTKRVGIGRVGGGETECMCEVV